MKFLLPLLSGALTLTALSQSSDYYIRPYTNVGPAGVIDGLLLDATPFGTQGFSNSSAYGQATADLSAGQLKALAGLDSSTGYSIALAEFSDTLTLFSSERKDFAFSFSYDGRLIGDAKSVPEGGVYQLFVSANFAVFRSGEADWDTWYDKATAGNALFYDQDNVTVTDPLEGFDEYVSNNFYFPTVLEAGREDFEFFARIQIGLVANTPQTAQLDFQNTATFGFDTDASVEAYSASGVLPGTQPIPEPSMLALAALAGFTGLRRRR